MSKEVLRLKRILNFNGVTKCFINRIRKFLLELVRYCDNTRSNSLLIVSFILSGTPVDHMEAFIEFLWTCNSFTIAMLIGSLMFVRMFHSTEVQRMYEYLFLEIQSSSEMYYPTMLNCFKHLCMRHCACVKWAQCVLK